MVKVTLSLSVLLLAVVAVRGQSTIVIADYPKINEVPDVNSAQVQAWLKEIDLTGSPAIPKLTAPKGSPPDCANRTLTACTWTCDNCASDDITACAAAKTWGLTFDDGPSTETPRLLDMLKTQNLKASFFLIGSNVIQYPATAKRELDEGHHLASHTWSHTALTTLSNEQIVAEMKWTEKAVMAATGLRLKYMRPPYGDINDRVRFVLKKLGYIPVDWTGDQFDTNDWRIGSPFNGKTFTQADAVSTFGKSLDTYLAGDTSKGFYCLEHDVSKTVVDAALVLVPLGVQKKISFASVAGCENDATPYQAGGTAPMPTSSVSSSAPAGTKPTGTSSAGGASGTNGPTVVGNKNSAASKITSMGLVSAVIAVAAGALYA